MLLGFCFFYLVQDMEFRATFENLNVFPKQSKAAWEYTGGAIRIIVAVRAHKSKVFPKYPTWVAMFGFC